MKSPEVIYCSSSDEEPVFLRNQRLIREHRIREDQQDIRDHFSRVTDEVIEGKRKYLRVAAFPVASVIPRVVPLDSSLLVSVAYSPSTIKFKIMSDHKETGSKPSSPVVESKVGAFEAKQYQSSITSTNQISDILRRNGLKISPLIVVRAPNPD